MNGSSQTNVPSSGFVLDVSSQLVGFVSDSSRMASVEPSTLLLGVSGGKGVIGELTFPIVFSTSLLVMGPLPDFMRLKSLNGDLGDSLLVASLERLELGRAALRKTFREFGREG